MSSESRAVPEERNPEHPGGVIDSAASGKQGSGGKKLPFLTAAEFAKKAPEEVPWIVSPWVAQGCLTELDGKVKLAGKTTFVTWMVRALLRGADFLGFPTRECRVVWLTEQPEASFRETLRRAGLLESEDLFLLFWKHTLGMKWDHIVQAAAEYAGSKGAGLLIIDTVSQFARLSGDRENNSGDQLEAEPRRDSRRLHSLRGWGHGTNQQVFPGGPGSCGADGPGAWRGVRVTVGSDQLDCREAGLRGRDAPPLGAASRA